MRATDQCEVNRSVWQILRICHFFCLWTCANAAATGKHGRTLTAREVLSDGGGRPASGKQLLVASYLSSTEAAARSKLLEFNGHHGERDAMTFLAANIANSTLVLSWRKDLEYKFHSWGYRLGNNLEQLALGIAVGESKGLTTLQLPSRPGPIDDVLRFPSSHQIAISPHKVATRYCKNASESPSGMFIWSCVGLDLRDKHRILHTYVKPLLKVPVDPLKPASNVRELIIHMRSGDAWNQTEGHYVGLQPPCALYTWIIDGGFEGVKFNTVRIITEPDMQHPCLEILKAEYPRIVVQSKSVAEDAAAIINARFFVGSFSTFSQNLMLLNDDLDTYFESTISGHESVEAACDKLGDPRRVKVRIPLDGLTDASSAARREWMTSFQATELQVVSVCGGNKTANNLVLR
eukprot:TRINITY_DN92716_c0_g1_i1.p1 TRINITY_DN92716_c0_g1~~TRINITY_DN92716_c0_g1_i1.p1  ORF type:complete len:406 (+),score=43.74 TRINITY_DN92716_c0_g1_i1:49-1266(+)